MTTVVKGARLSNQGIASTRLKVNMGDLWKLEDDQGALYVTASKIGKTKLAGFDTRWHTSQLRPKFSAVAANYAASANVVVTAGQGTYFQVGDLIKNTATGEVMRVTAVSTDTLTVTHNWASTGNPGGTAADELMIIAPAYDENAQLQSPRTVTETQYTNYVQLFRHNFSISGSLQAVTENGGTYHGSDVELQREDMLLVHKRDINLACLFGKGAQSGTVRSLEGIIGFITANGTNRTNNTSAVTEKVFNTGLSVATRYNTRNMIGICSRQFAQIVTEWGLNNQRVQPGDKLYGLPVMDYISPHGRVRLLVDDALEGTEYKQYCVLVDVSKKGGPKMRMLRDTRVLKNREANGDLDGYQEEVLTEGTIEHGNPDFHYIFNSADTSA